MDTEKIVSKWNNYLTNKMYKALKALELRSTKNNNNNNNKFLRFIIEYLSHS